MDDTSREAVEQLAKALDASAYVRPPAYEVEAASTLRALTAERDALRAELDAASPAATHVDVQKFLDRYILQTMEEGGGAFGVFETGWHLQNFVNDWITKDMARAICRSLTDRGYCRYMRALWSDEGMPAGAGYGITPKGAEYLKTLQHGPET